MNRMSPRCGRVMLRYETAKSGAVLDDPVCGRPEGHGGHCRSEGVIARAAMAKRVPRDVRRERYRQLRDAGMHWSEALRLKDVSPSRWPLREPDDSGEYRRRLEARNAAGAEPEAA